MRPVRLLSLPLALATLLACTPLLAPEADDPAEPDLSESPGAPGSNAAPALDTAKPAPAPSVRYRVDPRWAELWAGGKLLVAAQASAEDGREAQMQALLLELIREHPASPLVAHAYALFADDKFERGHVEDALKLYQKLAQFSGELPAYAAYRAAWCYATLDHPKPKRSLEEFVRAIRLASDDAAHQGAAIRRAARLELLPVYAEVGRASRARDFFARVGTGPGVEDHSREMLESLADLYSDRGDDEAAATVSADARRGR